MSGRKAEAIQEKKAETKENKSETKLIKCDQKTSTAQVKQWITAMLSQAQGVNANLVDVADIVMDYAYVDAMFLHLIERYGLANHLINADASFERPFSHAMIANSVESWVGLPECYYFTLRQTVTPQKINKELEWAVVNVARSWNRENYSVIESSIPLYMLDRLSDIDIHLQKMRLLSRDDKELLYALMIIASMLGLAAAAGSVSPKYLAIPFGLMALLLIRRNYQFSKAKRELDGVLALKGRVERRIQELSSPADEQPNDEKESKIKGRSLTPPPASGSRQTTSSFFHSSQAAAPRRRRGGYEMVRSNEDEGDDEVVGADRSFEPESP